MSGELFCWPAFPFRPDPVEGVTQPFLRTHPRGVPFSLLNRQGKRLWWIIPTTAQIEQLQDAFPTADVRNPPWSEIYARLSHRGLSAVDIEKLNTPAVLNLLAPAETSSHGGRRLVGPEAVAPGAGPPTAQEEEIDWLAALHQLKGDRQLMRDVVGVFLTEAKGMLQRVRAAITAGDNSELRCGAQALRDALGYFKAKRSYEFASRLEAIGRDGNMEAAEEVYHQLEATVRQVTRELEAFARRDDRRQQRQRDKR